MAHLSFNNFFQEFIIILAFCLCLFIHLFLDTFMSIFIYISVQTTKQLNIYMHKCVPKYLFLYGKA